MKSIIQNEDGTFTIDGKVYVLQTEAIETKESVFAELVKDLERKEDRTKYSNSLIWLNNQSQFMFKHDEKTGIFWCSYTRFWSVFESKFGMNYYDIQSFTKCMVAQHFKLNGVTPVLVQVLIPSLVAQHFKLNGVTPFINLKKIV